MTTATPNSRLKLTKSGPASKAAEGAGTAEAKGPLKGSVVRPYKIKSASRLEVHEKEVALYVSFHKEELPLVELTGVFKTVIMTVPYVTGEMLDEMLASVTESARKVGLVPAVKLVSENENYARVMRNLEEETNIARAKQVKAKTLLPSAELQERLGISRQSISKAVAENRIFAVIGPSGKNFYPAFFSDERYGRRNLEKVSKKLESLPGGSKWQFFTTGKGSLGGKTPLDALAEGRLDDVLATAAAFIER